VAFGSSQFVSVKTLDGTFANGKTYGADAQVNINGSKAEVDGLTASVRTGDLDLTLTLDKGFAQQTAADESFQITGGGAKFQIGSEVSRQGQVNLGIGSVSTGRLGNDVVGYLSSLGSGGESSLVGGNTIQAQKVITAAIQQVATLRGRLGAFQKDILETNTNSLNVALENVTASESDIRDTDFAQETAAMTRSQILVQATTSVLAQANSSPQNVLTLLRGG
jgi:flagellin